MPLATLAPFYARIACSFINIPDHQVVRCGIDAAAKTAITGGAQRASNVASLPRARRAASESTRAAGKERASLGAGRCARSAARTGEPRQERVSSRTTIWSTSKRVTQGERRTMIIVRTRR